MEEITLSSLLDVIGELFSDEISILFLIQKNISTIGQVNKLI